MRVIFLAALAFMLVACSGNEKGDEKGKSAGEIMKNYTDTLATAPDKARDAAKKVNEQASETEKMIKDLDK